METPPKFIKNLETKADRMRKGAFAKKQQPDSPFGVKYAGLQSRMWAATLDSVILMFTVIPLSVWLTNMWLGQVDMTLRPLAMALDGVSDPLARGQIMREFIFAEARLHYLAVNTLLQLAGMFPYCMWFWKHYGATPGKMLSRQKLVILSTGENLNYMQGFWRCVGYIISSVPLFLGVIWVSFDKNRQSWHDKMVGSVVISSKKPKIEEGS